MDAVFLQSVRNHDAAETTIAGSHINRRLAGFRCGCRGRKGCFRDSAVANFLDKCPVSDTDCGSIKRSPDSFAGNLEEILNAVRDGYFLIRCRLKNGFGEQVPAAAFKRGGDAKDFLRFRRC